MLLHITFEDRRTFSLFTKNVEANLDLLNGFMDSGRVIHSAFVVDRLGSRTPLPLEAFDGQPVSEPMQALEIDFRKVLLVQAEATISDYRRVNLTGPTGLESAFSRSFSPTFLFLKG